MTEKKMRAKKKKNRIFSSLSEKIKTEEKMRAKKRKIFSGLKDPHFS
jgi:hypothetical protein